MDASRFERISRNLAERPSHAAGLSPKGSAGLIAGTAMVAGLAPAISAAQGATPVAGDDVELLFVQSIAGGTIAPSAGEDSAYTMALDHGLAQTNYLSDRPNRVVGATPTSEFIMFPIEASADDPPNAALVADGADGDMILVVEIITASLDETTGMLTYDVLLLGAEDVDMQFEQAVRAAPTADVTLQTCHLFIDGLAACTPWDPRC